jgi:hypothetical protein
MPKNALAPTPTNALASQQFPLQSEAATNPYTVALLRQATKDYPFIAQHNPIVETGVGPYFAETWPINEEGKPNEFGQSTRPKSIPIDRIGVQVYRPNDFTHHDLAGEILHVDPFAHETRAALTKSLTPAQIKQLQKQSMDYQGALDEGQSEADAIKNAADAAMRGYVLGQWPAKANESMNYDKSQRALLEQLKNYMKTGKR